MNRAMLKEHLAKADKHIALGARHISDQLARIAKLTRGGHNTTKAEALLKTMRETQATREEHRKFFSRNSGNTGRLLRARTAPFFA